MLKISDRDMFERSRAKLARRREAGAFLARMRREVEGLPVSAERGESAAVWFDADAGVLILDLQFGTHFVRTVVRDDDAPDWWRGEASIERTREGIWRRWRDLRAEIAPKPRLRLGATG